MFALLPLAGGLLLGWLAPRRTAVALEVVFYIVAVTILTSTAPDHGGEYRDIAWIAPALAIASAGALLLGMRFGRAGRRHAAAHR
jgi:hypothetical protein